MIVFVEHVFDVDGKENFSNQTRKTKEQRGKLKKLIYSEYSGLFEEETRKKSIDNSNEISL